MLQHAISTKRLRQIHNKSGNTRIHSIGDDTYATPEIKEQIRRKG